MDILDRYLKSVQFWLPKDQSHDIIAELSEDIRSEVEDTESELGRPLTENEMCALLKRRGNPLAVAEQYLPKRYLIGPALFPVYWMLLRSFVLYFLLPWAVLWLCFTAAVPTYYDRHPVVALLRTVAPMWTIGINSIIGLTAGFAILERVRSRLWQEESWEPAKLPVVRDPNRVPRSTSIAEVVWNSFILLWWVNALGGPSMPDLHVAPGTSIMQLFYWTIVLFLLATVLMGLANVLWPVWTRRRAAIRLAIDTFGLALIGAMIAMWAKGGNFASISADTMSPAALEAANRWINLSVVITLAAIGVNFVARAMQDTRRVSGKQPLSSRAIRLITGE